MNAQNSSKSFLQGTCHWCGIEYPIRQLRKFEIPRPDVKPQLVCERHYRLLHAVWFELFAKPK